MQLQQQKQLELELRQARGAVGGVVGGGGSSADSIREVVNAAISLEFQRQRDRDYNSRQVGLGSYCRSQPMPRSLRCFFEKMIRLSVSYGWPNWI